MSTVNNISLKLSFNQVLDVVKQLPEERQKKLLSVIQSNSSKPEKKKLSEKTKKFLEGLSESVEFVNNYEAGNQQTLTLTQFLNEL